MRTLTHKIWSRLGSEGGQAFVEFVIVLPLLVLLVFGITQFGLTFRNHLAITDAARVAARAAAVKRTSNPCAAGGPAWTAIMNTLSPGQQSAVDLSGAWCTTPDGTDDVGGRVVITIKYPYTIGLPGVSASGDLTSSATERME